MVVEFEALDALIEAYQKLEALQLEHRDSGQLDLWSARSRRAYQSAQVAGMLDVARRIILSEQRPLKRGDLVARLEARGFTIAGADKNKVLGTNLWRSKKFSHVEGQGYWPVDVPIPTRLRQR